MSNFVYDQTSLAYPKTNLVPLGIAPHNKYIVDTDWNDLCQAAVDLRDALGHGNYFGFTTQITNPSPTDITNTWLWVRDSDGQLIHNRPDGSQRELADKNSDFLPTTDSTYSIGNSTYSWAGVVANTISASSANTLNVFEWGAGDSAAVSAADTGRIRYNTDTDHLEISVNGGAYEPITPSLATWSLTQVRYIMISEPFGDDNNLGYVDAALGTDLSALAPTIAVKTLRKGLSLIPTFGAGRSLELVIQRHTGGTTYQISGVDEDLYVGVYGYSHIAVRGTDTSTTAGCTAFDNTAADHIFAGGQTVSSTNAAGYKITATSVAVTGATAASPIVLTVVGHGFSTNDRVNVESIRGINAANGVHKITVVDADHISLDGSQGLNSAAFLTSPNGLVKRWKVTTAAGGAPGFTDEASGQALYNKRVRFSATTTTVSLRNFVTTFVCMGVDTVVPKQDISGLVSSDVCYIEEPGVSVGNMLVAGRFSLVSSVGAAVLGIDVYGFRCTTLSFTSADLIRSAFNQITGSFIVNRCPAVTCGNVSTGVLGVFYEVGPVRVTGQISITEVVALAIRDLGHFPTTEDSCTITQCIGGVTTGCIFTKGLVLLSCGRAVGTPQELNIGGTFFLGSTSGNIRPSRVMGVPAASAGSTRTLSGLLVSASSIRINSIEINNCPNYPAIGICGTGGTVTVSGAYGTVGNTGYGIGFYVGYDIGLGIPRTPSHNCSLILSAGNGGVQGYIGVRGTLGEIAFGTQDNAFAVLGYDNQTIEVRDAQGNSVSRLIGFGLTSPSANVSGAKTQVIDYRNDQDGGGETIAPYSVVRVSSKTGETSTFRRVRGAQADTTANATGVVGVSVSGAIDNNSILVAGIGQCAWVRFDVSGGRPAPTVTEPSTLAYLSDGTAKLAQASTPASGVLLELGPVMAVHPVETDLGLILVSPRFATSSTLTGTAGGDLTGTYPNPTIAALAVTDAKVAAANKDGLAATPSMRTLGTGATQAAAGDDTRFGLAFVSATDDTIDYLGNKIIAGTGATVTETNPGGGHRLRIDVTGAPPTGTAGGDLTGTYPNPTIAALAVTAAKVAAANKDGTTSTPSMRTLGTGAQQAAAGDDSRFGLSLVSATDDTIDYLVNKVIAGTGIAVTETNPGGGHRLRIDTTGAAPTGSAGGDLTGTYPNPTIAALAVTDAKVAAANKDGTTSTPSMRTLGTGAQQAAAGDDSRLSDSRAPSGSAGGDLSGTYPNPNVAAIHETSGPTKLTFGAIADGDTLTRSGSTIIGAAGGAGGPPTGAAGGDLGSSYPNPTVIALHETSGPTKLTLGAVADLQVLARSGSTIIGVTQTATDTKEVKVSSDDTTPAFLEDKVLGNGVVTVTVQNSAANENILLAIASASITDTHVAAANKDGASGTPSMRTLGTGAAQAAAGNDGRLSDSRAPSGSAGGDLSGTYPNPNVAAIHETSGPTKLTFGAIAAGELLTRSGSTIVGTTITSAAPSGAAGGDLTGTYPNPTIAALAVTDAKVAAANKDGTTVTPSMRTLGTGASQAAAGNDSRFLKVAGSTADTVPNYLENKLASGTTITVTKNNPGPGTNDLFSFDVTNASLTDAKVATANKDGLAATPSMRTLGTGAAQAAAGNDARLSDARTPTGTASGDLSGTYPSPNVAAIHETSGPTKLTFGTISNGQVLIRSGSTIIGTTSTDTDEKAKVSANDATTGYLNGKLVAGTAVTLTENNDGGAETLTIAVPTANLVYASATDDIPNVLDNKLIAGTGITITEFNPGSGHRLLITSTGAAPTGAAGGDLSGTYPNPTIAALAVTAAKVATANKDGLAATPSMRTLGTGATQAAAGNDSRFYTVKGSTADTVPNYLENKLASGATVAVSKVNPGPGTNDLFTFEVVAASLTDAKVATANKDGIAATPSMRTLGTGATQAAAGNDSRFGLTYASSTDDIPNVLDNKLIAGTGIAITEFNPGSGHRLLISSTGGGAPSGTAGGDLSGTYPNPNVVAVHDGSSTRLTVGTLSSSFLLGRSASGNTITSFEAEASATNHSSRFANATLTFGSDMDAEPRRFAALSREPSITQLSGFNFSVGAFVGTHGDGNRFSNSGGSILTVSAPHATIARWDLVKYNYSTATLSIATGTLLTGGAYNRPSLSAAEVALFDIYVPASAATLSSCCIFRATSRKITAPASQMWGVVQGCNLALDVFGGLINTQQINSVIIDGELVQGNGWLDGGFDTVSANMSMYSSSTVFKPIYIYACGGRHNPQIALTAVPPGSASCIGSAPLRLVYSGAEPDRELGCSSANLNYSGVASGVIDRLGCVYVGISYIYSNVLTLKPMNYADDWAYNAFPSASGEFDYDISGTLSSANSWMMSVSLANLPITSTHAAIRLELANNSTSPATHTVTVTSPNSATDATFGRSLVVAQALHYAAIGITTVGQGTGIVPLIGSTPSLLVRSNGSSGSDFFDIRVDGVNMNVPRITNIGIKRRGT